MDQLLQLELRFLLLRHGRRKVIEELAALGEQTPADIEQALALVAARATRKESKPKPTTVLIAEGCKERPEILEKVQALASRFENRTFLPQLKDVRRFLDRSGIAHPKKLKSRQASINHVIRALTQMPIDELNRYAASDPPDKDSDYALLAREIMGTTQPTAQDAKPRK